jgi:hypothetical protein
MGRKMSFMGKSGSQERKDRRFLIWKAGTLEQRQKVFLSGRRELWKRRAGRLFLIS